MHVLLYLGSLFQVGVWLRKRGGPAFSIVPTDREHCYYLDAKSPWNISDEEKHTYSLIIMAVIFYTHKRWLVIFIVHQSYLALMCEGHHLYSSCAFANA